MNLTQIFIQFLSTYSPIFSTCVNHHRPTLFFATLYSYISLEALLIESGVFSLVSNFPFTSSLWSWLLSSGFFLIPRFVCFFATLRHSLIQYHLYLDSRGWTIQKMDMAEKRYQGFHIDHLGINCFKKITKCVDYCVLTIWPKYFYLVHQYCGQSN